MSDNAPSTSLRDPARQATLRPPAEAPIPSNVSAVALTSAPTPDALKYIEEDLQRIIKLFMDSFFQAQAPANLHTWNVIISVNSAKTTSTPPVQPAPTECPLQPRSSVVGSVLVGSSLTGKLREQLPCRRSSLRLS